MEMNIILWLLIYFVHINEKKYMFFNLNIFVINVERSANVSIINIVHIGAYYLKKMF